MEHFKTGGFEILFHLIRHGADLRICWIQAEQMDLEGCDGPGPDDAIGIVVLLDRGGHGARDANAIAPHDHGLLLALLVQKRAVHALGILDAELEDLAHFNAAEGLEVTFSAPRAGVAFCGHSDVREGATR